MKTATSLRTLGAAYAILALLCHSALAQTKATVSLAGPAGPVTEGSTFAVNIDITGVKDLYGFQFDLDFNHSLLTAISSKEGALLPSGGATFFIPGTIDNAGGSVANNADTLLTAVSGVNGNGVLATIDFTGTGAGTSALTLANVVLLNSSLNRIPDSLVNGSVTLRGSTSVLEPGPLGLLFLGIAGILAFQALERMLKVPD